MRTIARIFEKHVPNSRNTARPYNGRHPKIQNSEDFTNLHQKQTRLTLLPVPSISMLPTQATVATLGVSVRYGLWGEAGEDMGCTAVACLVWLGLGALFSTAFVRVYRYHNVLVKHSGDMWPVVSQVSRHNEWRFAPEAATPDSCQAMGSSVVEKKQGASWVRPTATDSAFLQMISPMAHSLTREIRLNSR